MESNLSTNYVNDKLKTVKELFVNSAELYVSGFWKFLGLAIVPVVCKLLLTLVMLGSVPMGLFLKEGSPFFLIATILGVVFYIVLTLGYIYMTLAADLGAFLLLKNFSKEKKVIDIFKETFPHIGKFLWLSLFTSGLILLWSLLLIVPGILFAVYYSFVIWVFVFENKTGMEAVNRSKELVKGRWWDVFFRYIALFGGIIVVVLLLDSIPLPEFLNSNEIIKGVWRAIILILQFLITPLPVIYSYFLYKDLGGNTVSSGTAEIKPLSKTVKKILVVLFVVVFIIIAIGATFFIKMYAEYKVTSKELEQLNTLNNKVNTSTNNMASTSTDVVNTATNYPINSEIDKVNVGSRDAKRIFDVIQIRAALELYKSDHNSYPEKLSLLSEYQVTDDLIDTLGNDYQYAKINDNYKLCFTLEMDKYEYKKGENCFNKDSK